jgi:predicted nucleic acid-binding Zn ribbon protein
MNGFQEGSSMHKRGRVQRSTGLVFGMSAHYNAPGMRPPNERASTVAEVLGDVLKRVDPEQQMRVYGIWKFWADEVGELIARRTQPSRFRNGILFVTVATQSWMQELQFMKDSIREKLNARLGADLVRDIFFTSGTIESAVLDAPRERRPSGRALVSLPAMADPALAAAFTGVVEARARRLARSRQRKK